MYKYNKKKISIIIPNLAGGGSEKVYLLLANNWIKKDYDVEFVLFQRKGEWLQLLSPKILVKELNIKRIRYALFSLIRYFKNCNSDIVLVSSWPLTSISIIAWLLSLNYKKIFIVEHQILSKSYINNKNYTLWYLKVLVRLTYL